MSFKHLILLLCPILSTVLAQPVAFNDVTVAAGVIKRNWFKWGGPTVVDLDGDGIYDLIFSHHFSFTVEIYWGNGDGTFTRGPFRFQNDVHGITVGFRTARSQQRVMSINVGGGRGNNLRPPHMYFVNSDRSIANKTFENGLGQAVGRGRVTLFMDLSFGSFRDRRRDHGGHDHVVISFVANGDSIKQHAYQNFRGSYTLKDVPGLNMETEGRGELLDLNNDRRMEVLSFPRAQLYRPTGPFTFADVTSSVFPSPLFSYTARTTGAVAEFDMSNRGVFDLYMARTLLSDLIPFSAPQLPSFDVLLRNVNGQLVDISSSAGIPRNTRSVGVTSGDFDNSGFVDLFVSVAQGPDFFLMNNGDQTFTQVSASGIIPKAAGTFGDHAVGVDYDEDGRLDLIVGQGGKEGPGAGGSFLIMKNVLAIAATRHYLLVRVGHHPRQVATALHAVVSVRVGGMTMVRRIGSPGTQGGGPSMLTTVHFGLGSFTSVRWVRVRWIAGGAKRVFDVAADQKISFGNLS